MSERSVAVRAWKPLTFKLAILLYFLWALLIKSLRQTRVIGTESGHKTMNVKMNKPVPRKTDKEETHADNLISDN